jgi:hypothetical protein
MNLPSSSANNINLRNDTNQSLSIHKSQRSNPNVHGTTSNEIIIDNQHFNKSRNVLNLTQGLIDEDEHEIEISK